MYEQLLSYVGYYQGRELRPVIFTFKLSLHAVRLVISLLEKVFMKNFKHRRAADRGLPLISREVVVQQSNGYHFD